MIVYTIFRVWSTQMKKCTLQLLTWSMRYFHRNRILDLESPHVCHSANCGEFQTTRPRLQVPSFKASLFKSSCHNFSKNCLLHTVNQGQRKVYTIDSNMNKCHWHSPMRKQLRRALGMLKAICQPFPSTTWMHQNIFMNKIYLEQNIFRTKYI